MKNLKFLSLLLIVFSASIFPQNSKLNIGDPLPNPQISWTDYKIIPEIAKVDLYDYKKNSYLLVAVMPDITESNNAAKIILTGLDSYFAEGLSFRPFDEYMYNNPELRVLVISASRKGEAENIKMKYGLNFDVISDNTLDISNAFGVNKWGSGSDASFIYIADKDNKIIYSRDDYKGEGEKLKDIQSNLFTCFNLKPGVSNENYYSPLIQGDDARDFTFTVAGSNEITQYKLSDYFGKKNVLLAFYPAPYSYSCAYEVKTFDTFAEKELIKRVSESGNDETELLMVSVSNSYILNSWKKEMGIEKVKLLNDNDGSISMKYSSYNPFGYSNRTVFLINKEGKVQYIDWNYNVNNDDDFGIIKEMLTAAK